MIRRRLLAGFGLAAVLMSAGALSGCSDKPSQSGDAPKELTFSILSAESQQNMGPLWQPLLDDMSKQIGVKVKPYFATNYTSLIEAMRFNQVQVGWFSALPALEAVRRADGEVLGRVVDATGEGSYQSVLIARKGSNITLEDVVKCDRRFSFGLGDAKSTTGTLAPMAYLFTPRNIEPAKCFKAVRSASHQANVFSVANGVLDVATNNTVGLVFAAKENPAIAEKVEVIWRSPPIPESSIVARKDLDPAVKEKLRQFFLTYGTGEGPEAERQRKVLKDLEYGGFKPADDSYLDPIREMESSQTLAEARRSGDAARIKAAQEEFDKIHAAAAQRRAVNPDV
ncbi:phosphate/phosphite/phosphonate ABC transporter substrate-binding protein [Phenylobacterium deserti]|uniref:Phosphate/phosphite/phosphonate ABC transporter substrate-binding protein n=1 Tax=Phenylobacterium deserti TaxID=1914756 RepID=A0A328AR47_9CAUL|nr:phosphate/phosphite/phosphonate ABC transporter substrate-binding protein [Phenylobacterium deserti]RAK57490.1 phosphate/phosphite/phosphonate ABC transporter substrate-binding protein [Phenylobacterium deserti]